MIKNGSNGRRRRGAERGVGLVELMVVVAIVLITTVIALPNFLKVLRSSQLSNGATQMADILKQTRFQSIRRNTTITCRISPSASATTVYVDSNGNSQFDRGEIETVYTGNVSLVAAGGVPGTSSLANGVGSGITLTPVSPTAGTYSFDARGAVSPAAVYVMYVANTAIPSIGYRAVVLLPSGSIQIWTADAAGNWRLLE
jgi:Tfp pilus assembly protein FimT